MDKYEEFDENKLNLNYLITTEDISFNFTNWIDESSNALFIIGISGSGKSTLAKQLIKEYNCEYVSLDIFVKRKNLNMEWLKYYYPLIYEYFMNIDKIDSKDCLINTSKKNIINELSHLIRWLVYKNKKRVIIEGNELIKILLYKNKKNIELLKVPIICKHTSILISILRKLKEGYKKRKLFSLLKQIKKYYSSNIKEYKLLIRKLLKLHNNKYDLFVN